MKKSIVFLSALCAFLQVISASASDRIAKSKGVRLSDSTDKIPQVVVIAADDVRKCYIPPLMKTGRLKSGARNALPATINVTYNGFSDEAKAAFQYAVDIWSSQVTSTVSINIVANWKVLDPNVLGSCGASDYAMDFTGAPETETWYPIALAEKIAGEEINDSSEDDIHANFNSSFANWYLGTDGKTPVDKYDFVMVVLHELCHGLGFIGSFGYSAGSGSWGGGGILATPTIYDKFIYNGTGKLLIDTDNFDNPSDGLGAQFTGGDIFFKGIYAGTFEIYAPAAWNSGSSMVHVDQIYNGTENALMTFSVSKGEAVHWPGPIVRNLYRDIGWLVIPEPENAWAAGSNALGQLGISSGSVNNQPQPVFIEGVADVIDISAGAYHTAAVKEDGSLWAWGKNEYGQIGDGTTTQRLQPVHVAGLSDMISVSCGNSHTLGLKKDGTVYAWGYNFYGQLGNGTSNDSHQPVQVPGLQQIVQISAGDYHSLALCSDGTVYAWGWNGLKQIDPARGEYILSPVVVPGLSGIRKISAGGEHSIALDKNKNVWTWGWNWYGQIGDGTTSFGSGAYKIPLTGAIDVAAGIGHSIALKDDGTVWTWGLNDFGQLGSGNNLNSSVPTAVQGLVGIADIASGSWHTIAVNADKECYVWGRNTDGDLGIGETGNSKSSPVKIQSISKFHLVDGGYHYLVFLSEFNQNTVKVEVSAFPENGGTTNPSGNLLGNKSIPLDITATVENNWSFVNWTAEPPANAIFADASALTTTATLLGDVKIAANFQSALCTLTMAASPVAGGTVDPSSSQTWQFHIGEKFNVSAIAAQGYSFVSWTAEPPANAAFVDTTSPTTEASLAGDATITANFVTSATLTMAISPEKSGTTSPVVGEKTIPTGVSIDISATANDGYHFVSWSATENAELTNSTAANTTAVLAGNATITANFAVNIYTVTFTENGEGTLEGETTQTVVHGEDCTPVEAIPHVGCEFVNWISPGFTSTDNPITLTNVASDTNVIANFAVKTYEVTFTAGQNGSISGVSPQTVEHGSDCVPVQAVADTGYKFSGWSGDYVGVENPITISGVTSGMSITANFAVAQATLTMGSIPANLPATLTPAAGPAQVNTCEDIQITAVGGEGVNFVKWTIDANGQIANPLLSQTTVRITGDATVIAEFSATSPENTAVLTMEVLPDASSGTTDPAQGSAITVEKEVKIRIEAVPGAGYYFIGWTADNENVNFNSAAARLTYVTIYSDSTVTANFAPIPAEATLIVAVSPMNTGSTTPESGTQNTVQTSVPIEIAAVPEEGWFFTGWTLRGPAQIDDQFSATTNVTISDNSLAIANFSQASPMTAVLTMAVTQFDGDGDELPETDAGTTVPPVGTHTVNTYAYVKISATAVEGYMFSEWTGTENASIGDTTLEETTVSLSGDAVVTAIFTDLLALEPLEVKVTSTHKEYVEKESDSGSEWYAEHSKDTFSISVKFDMSNSPLNLEDINQDTEIEFGVGTLYDLSSLGFGTLGDAGELFIDKGTKGSATFLMKGKNGKGRDVVTQKIIFKWDKKKIITITVKGAPLVDSEENIFDLSDAASGKTGPLPEQTLDNFYFRLGNLEWDGSGFSVICKGSGGTRTIIKNDENFDLTKWSVKGRR